MKSKICILVISPFLERRRPVSKIDFVISFWISSLIIFLSIKSFIYFKLSKLFPSKYVMYLSINEPLIYIDTVLDFPSLSCILYNFSYLSQISFILSSFFGVIINPILIFIFSFATLYNFLNFSMFAKHMSNKSDNKSTY